MLDDASRTNASLLGRVGAKSHVLKRLKHEVRALGGLAAIGADDE